jgi:hypothetical protein
MAVAEDMPAIKKAPRRARRFREKEIFIVKDEVGRRGAKRVVIYTNLRPNGGWRKACLESFYPNPE